MNKIDYIMMQMEKMTGEEITDLLIASYEQLEVRQTSLLCYPHFIQNAIQVISLMTENIEDIIADCMLAYPDAFSSEIEALKSINANQFATTYEKMVEMANDCESFQTLQKYYQREIGANDQYALYPILVKYMEQERKLYLQARQPHYEYDYQRISLPRLFLSEKALQKADEQKRRIIDDYAKKGWRLTQIIQPFTVETMLRVYYELIFERAQQSDLG